MKQQWTLEELEEHWLLQPDEQELLNNKLRWSPFARQIFDNLEI